MNFTRSAKPASARTSFERMMFAPLALLKAHDRVRSLLVMSTFEEAMPLRSIKDDDAKARVKAFALLCGWNIRRQRRKFVRFGDLGCGFVISLREVALRPSPHTRAATNFERSVMVVSIDPA